MTRYDPLRPAPTRHDPLRRAIRPVTIRHGSVLTVRFSRFGSHGSVLTVRFSRKEPNTVRSNFGKSASFSLIRFVRGFFRLRHHHAHRSQGEYGRHACARFRQDPSVYAPEQRAPSNPKVFDKEERDESEATEQAGGNRFAKGKAGSEANEVARRGSDTARR